MFCFQLKKTISKLQKYQNNKINLNFKKYNCRFQKLDEVSLKKEDTNRLYSHQTPLKSDEYLINRYLKHPLYNYYIYSVSIDNILEILIVVRPIKIKGTLVMTIVDFIGSNDNFYLLPSTMSFLCDKYNAEYVDIYSCQIPKKTLDKVGLLNVRKIKSLIIPGLFEPFEKKIIISFVDSTQKTLLLCEFLKVIVTLIVLVK